MRNELAGADLPNADFAVEAARAYEFLIEAQANGSYAVLVSIVNGPQRLRVLNAEGPDAAVRPASNDHLVCKERADGVQSRGDD